MKITINKIPTLDSWGQLIPTGTIEEVNFCTLLVTIREGLKYLGDKISSTEDEEQKYKLADLISDAAEIHNNIRDAVSGVLNELNY
ncbi:MAG: hypothetical protein WC446_04920 [Candidatus Paceibacterota bacterium]|jgi:hypothetical protein